MPNHSRSASAEETSPDTARLERRFSQHDRTPCTEFMFLSQFTSKDPEPRTPSTGRPQLRVRVRKKVPTPGTERYPAGEPGQNALAGAFAGVWACLLGETGRAGVIGGELEERDLFLFSLRFALAFFVGC